jgi:hypothetical protein
MRVDISAAAFGAREGARFRVVACAGAVLVALGIAAGGSARSGAVSPLVQVTPKELRLSQPLAALDAEGNRVAFAFCNQLLGVWRPGTGVVTRLGAAAQWTCPPPRGLERTYSLAFAGDRVAWIAESGGNQVINLLFLVVLGQPQVITIAADVSYCCRSLDPDRERMPVGKASSAPPPGRTRPHRGEGHRCALRRHRSLLCVHRSRPVGVAHPVRAMGGASGPAVGSPTRG